MTTRTRRRAVDRRWRSRRIRALLAAGVVLGVGGAATLAAWNDVEQVTASFTGGSFGIVGSVDGEDFQEHASAEGAAALSFAVNPGALVPGATVYAGFSVKTKAGSVAGTVQLAADSGNSGGLGAHLRYGVRTTVGQACDQSTFAGGAGVVAPGAVLTAGAASAQSMSANGSAQINYCFAVTLPVDAPNSAQGMTVAPTWTFEATSAQ